MSRRKQLSTTHRLAFRPDFANSSRFHSAPFQRRPVNRSTGPRFHVCRAWRRRVHSVPPSQIVEDRLPRRRERESFRQVPQPAGRASGPCRNFRPHSAPKISPTSAAPGKPLALRLPATHQATAPVSPGRQKSEHRGPAPMIRPAAFPDRPACRHSQSSTTGKASRAVNFELTEPPCES